eukprot:NODE_4_length_55019_cov_0.425091.p3 type:complete len:696 gc:universal NODE_4_length_55019_cov_0.425091:4249-2162(-)
MSRMSIDLKIIGKSILLTTPSSCYVFGPNEGFQRDVMHARLSLQNVSHVFLSDRQNSTGLFGLLMTNSVSGKHTSIFASNMNDYVQAMSIFTERLPHATIFDFLRSNLEDEIQKKQVIKDIKFDKLCRISNGEPGIKINRELSFYEDAHIKVFPMFVKKGSTVKRKKVVKSNAVDTTLLSWCIHLPSFRGKIDIDAVDKLKIPRRDLRIISANQEYVLNGKKINLDMISGPPRFGRIILLLNCPSMEYCEDLATHPYLNIYTSNFRSLDILVVHSTTSNIYNSPEYQSIVTSLSNATHHLIDIKSDVGLPFYQQQIQKLSSVSKYFSPSSGIMWDESFIDFSMYPLFTKTIRKYNPIEVTKPLILPDNVPIFTAYGTGSAIPQVNQNVSGYSLFYKNKRFLLDPGEDTLRSIIFSVRNGTLTDEENWLKEKEYWSALRCIYISHGHADHHSGLQNILKRWSECTKNTSLFVVVTPKLLHWLTQLSKQLEYIDFDRIHLLLSNWFTPIEYQSDSRLSTFNFNKVNLQFKSHFLKQLDIQFDTIPVNHPGQANAVKICTDGFTFVYSGDTRYCQGLSNLASNCDLLVHECTFESHDVENAFSKQHSTLSDANRVFMESKAKRMILTHFSTKFKQHHPESILKECEKSKYKIVPAHDGLTIPITDEDFDKYGRSLQKVNAAIDSSHLESKSQPELIKQ